MHDAPACGTLGHHLLRVERTPRHLSLLKKCQQMSNQQRFQEKAKMGKKTTKRGSQTSMKVTKKTHRTMHLRQRKLKVPRLNQEEGLLEDTSNGMEDISEPGSTDGLVDNLEAVDREQEEPWRQKSQRAVNAQC
ncbi:hypothetical protein MRX96_006800 [Rhipicephalus microplus]